MGAHEFKLFKVPLFSRKSVNINVSLSAAPKLALVPQCLCQVLLGLKEVQMGSMTSNLSRCLFFSKLSVNINVSLSAAPKLALVPASRYYCDVNWSNHNVCAKFH